MDCKKAEKMIPNFIEHKLNYFELKEFDEHLKHCADCNEELVIQFLVSEGMQRLEEGDAFDLQKELDTRLSEAGRKLKFQGFAVKIGFILEIICTAAFLGLTIWILI
ncbi:MAG: zf-HC2 domain-containing protein [Lachnospiraceae bacterium]|nr:zf-HC2 domain-containing protein [Lachnospiraceae bacterium]